MKVAYYSPLPPDRSGIADYSALLLPALARRIEVEVVRRGVRRAPRKADAFLYHVGNDPERHAWIVEALRKHPGVVVLHDFVLHHLVAGMTLGRGDGVAYVQAMQREAGVVGRLLAHGVIDGVVPPLWETRAEEFPLSGEVLEHATALIVHSRYVHERAREAGYGRRIWQIPHPVWRPPEAPPDRALPTDRSIVIGSFGNLTATKRIPQLLDAFARIRSRVPEAVLVLAGAPAPGFDLAVHLERLGLRLDENVLYLGYVREEQLWSVIARSDICVSLRYPTMGETSGVVIRALALGRPVVVSDVGWFSELPESVVAKVPVDEWEVDTLAAVLERLCEDPQLRNRLGENGREHMRSEHDLDLVAERYAAALEQEAGGELVRDAVVEELARAASDVGIGADDPELELLARRLAEVGLGD
ncbi:MAG: glycosyltransferase family 4 protein [Actinomycetota bacterium]|nr:glycosyltransferase family 4 protein [Actinomycetota bacterium]